MSDGRSIRLPSANFAQVREPGRNGPAVTRFPRVGRGGSNPLLCTKCQRARIGIAACLRNRCLRVQISPLAPIFPTVENDETLPVLSKHYSLGSTGSLSKASTPNTHSWTRRRGSLWTKRSSASIPSANSRRASDRFAPNPRLFNLLRFSERMYSGP